MFMVVLRMYCIVLPITAVFIFDNKTYRWNLHELLKEGNIDFPSTPNAVLNDACQGRSFSKENKWKLGKTLDSHQNSTEKFLFPRPPRPDLFFQHLQESKKRTAGGTMYSNNSLTPIYNQRKGMRLCGSVRCVCVWLYMCVHYILIFNVYFIFFF